MPSRETHALTTVLLANGKNGGRFLAVPVSCPSCQSANVDMLGHTRPAARGRSIGAVLRCLDCKAEEVLAIHLEPFNQRRANLKETIASGGTTHLPPINHGCRAGYRQHLRRGEDPCDPCHAANVASRAAERARAKERASGLAVAS